MKRLLYCLSAALALVVFRFGSPGDEPPKVGARAPDSSLKTPDDQAVRLSALTPRQPVVLVVLRGWTGYQCPISDRPVQDFIAAARAQVAFVYPGPADGLKAHAKESAALKGKDWPTEFLSVLDPDYSMVNAYGLRWDAPRKTAYASTFVLLDARGVVRFAKIRRSHGDRTKAADMLKEVRALKAG